MKRITNMILTILSVLTIGLSISPVALAAVDPNKAVTDGVTAAGGDSKGGLNLRDGLKLVVNVLLFLRGAIAVIMIVVGGLRYVLSSGDSNQLTAAKNTILYAVVGLIVALLSYAIVNWVIDQFAK